MRAQHTPGPWLTKGSMSNFDKGKESIFVVNAKGDSKRIAQTSNAFNGSETRANARLIAAAPKLLEALDNLIKQTIDDMGLRLLPSTHPLAIAQAIVAEAKGE